MQTPTVLHSEPSTTSLPRIADGEVSAMNTGQVDDVTPIPNPLMIRPTIICGRWYAAICRMAPAMLRVRPSQMVLRRPRRSPKVKLAMHPKKAPSYRTINIGTPRHQGSGKERCFAATHGEAARGNPRDVGIG